MVRCVRQMSSPHKGDKVRSIAFVVDSEIVHDKDHAMVGPLKATALPHMLLSSGEALAEPQGLALKKGVRGSESIQNKGCV